MTSLASSLKRGVNTLMTPRFFPCVLRVCRCWSFASPILLRRGETTFYFSIMASPRQGDGGLKLVCLRRRLLSTPGFGHVRLLEHLSIRFYSPGDPSALRSTELLAMFSIQSLPYTKCG